MRRFPRLALAALAVTLAGCVGIPAAQKQPATTVPSTSASTTVGTIPSPTAAARPDVAASLSERIRPLGSARFVPRADPPPAPVTLSLPDLGIRGASIVDVGVEPDGEMEIPGASEVGWYRYGPVPGDRGSAVLAAHIAFDGRDGVFRRLAALEIGAIVEVGFEDGSSRSFRVVELGRYPKEALPLRRVFAKDGEPVLTLVTCGGAFDRSAGSYEDNVVVYAAPVDPG